MIRYQITDGTADLARLSPDVDFIQIREPALSTRELAAFVRAAIAACGTHPGILVNDRTDVAIACGAAGVHLRAGSVWPNLIREVIREQGRLIVTVACHNEAELQRAAGADYALLSPVFPPLSKRDHREPLGLDRLARMIANSPVPVLALGGITPANAASCIDAGAVGVAGITLFA